MKFTKRILGLMLMLLFVASLMSGCSKGNDFTAADVINRSSSQQLWLKSPESKIVMNPAAVNAGADFSDKRDMTVAPLCLGLMNDSGEIVSTYDDLLFFLESDSANGLGAEVIQTMDFDGAKGLSKFEVAAASTSLIFTVPESVTSAKLVIRPTNGDILLDLNDESLYMKVEIAEISDGCVFGFQPSVTADINYDQQNVVSWSAPGTYFCPITRIAEYFKFTPFENGNKTTLNFHVSGPGSYSITSCELVKLSSGCHEGDKAASTEWAPYYMKADVTYPQLTSLSLLDFFSGPDTVIRQVTTVSSGSVTLAGKIYGNCTYDSKQNSFLMINGSDVIAIVLKRKGTMNFYASYEDMLSNQNALETAAGATYWSIDLGSLIGGDEADSFNCAVTLSNKMNADDALAASSDCVSITKAKRVYAALEEYWDNYIAENDVSDYITVIPEK